MSSLTIYLGKLLGLYLLIFGAAMAANQQGTIATVEALIRLAPAMLIVDMATVAVGLAMVLGHNVWSGGALPVVITVLGWMALIKGLLFLFLPQPQMINLYEAIQYERLFFAYVVVTLALGLYLSISAFRHGRLR